ncbi:hypothetical protein [Brucella intermedia]|uniref:hypothetical protein n=1 Tax=Brucella intermedia TaxID=94625 RepID=UPI00124D15E8|nr:hypothetical protein [Brucella intermedia]KAB2733636.1 hypothetical protein F9L02_01275 [Brucella intermedia]
MNLFLKIACVVVFVAVMVALHQGYYAVAHFFEGSFSMGFILGGCFAFGIALLCQKLEARK